MPDNQGQSDKSELQQQFENLYEFAPCGYVTLNPQGLITRANRMAVKLLGTEKSQLWNMSLSRFIVPAWEKLFFAARQRAEKSGEKQSVELLLKREHKSQLWVLMNIEAGQSRDHEPMEWRVVLVDIHERKQAEDILWRQQRSISMNKRIAQIFLMSDQEQLFPDVLDVLLDILDSRYGYFGYIDDAGDLVCPSMTRSVYEQCRMPDKQIVFPRAAWNGLWGRSLLERKTQMANSDLQVPDGHLPLENALAVPILLQDRLVGQFVVADKPGGYNGYDKELLESAAVQTAPILQAYLEQTRRNSEQEILERQFRQAQKMEALGTLAGGVAHDFNNILASMIGFTELALEETPGDSLVSENLREVLSAGYRAKELVKQILTISRREEQAKQAVEINLLLKEALKMLRSTMPPSIDIREQICEEPLLIWADPTQIHQVVLNLATNALQAMNNEQGLLEIDLREISLEEGDDRQGPELSPGRYACLTIRDTGSGIPEDQLDQIFEPYFTTKTQGTGTGLGLSVVHGIVKFHGGHIAVSSEPGKGTAFFVHLPLTREKPNMVPDHEEVARPVDGGHILVVDDETPVVKLLEQRLQRLGYTVTARTDSEQALQAFRDSPEAFDLILTDLAMPEMDGSSLAAAAKDIRADIPVLMCSGYTKHVEDLQSNGNVDAVLMKPTDSAELAQTIKSVLGA
jgi:PAS domain S-box-containing protein